MHLHVYCRKDMSKKAQYRVTLPTWKKGQLGSIKPYIGKPGTLMGPFHFGEAGGDDGFILVEKIR